MSTPQKNINRQIVNRLRDFIFIIIFPVLFFNIGCSKNPANPFYKKNTTDSSKIVYTDVNPDSVILKSPNSPFSLDLNNDGAGDFEFYSSKNTCDDGLIAPPVPYVYMSMEPMSGGNMMMANKLSESGGFSFVSVLDSSESIGPDSLWVDHAQYLLNGATESGYIRCMVVRGFWIDVLDKYIGLKLVKGNNTYYGWARLSSSFVATATPYRHLTSGQLILKDYAYNSVPDQPIAAGQTK